jgi:cobalt/nickel transport system permease protein
MGPSLLLPWAVHISDGVLSGPLLFAGFAVAGALALMAAYRVRDEEIPRIALLSAAFFVASSVHVKLGPSAAHLLLNGLVGVVLGRRAPLAILLGVTLQAVLIPHGGLSTIGINTCTQAVPALLAWWAFALLRRAPWVKTGWFRAGLVAVSAVIWAGGLVFAVVALATNPLAELLAVRSQAGLLMSALNIDTARAVTFHPLTLALIALFAALCAWAERRMGNAPEFPLGLLIGIFTVLATTALTGAVLLLDGKEKWETFVTVIFLGHLPLAVLEGVVLGCTVGFLARVKPEMLGEVPARAEDLPAPEPASVPIKPPALVLAFVALLLTARPASAHQLLAEYYPDAAKQTVKIESWFETGDAPRRGNVEVFREDGSLLTKGPLDGEGVFVFRYEKSEALKVVVSAPGGHRKELLVPAKDLQARPSTAAAEPAPPENEARPNEPGRLLRLVLGVSLVLALAAFVVAIRNARRK